MKETTNLKLKKYDYSDTADMSTAHNPNMDVIDTEIKSLKDTLGTGLKASNISIADASNVFASTNVEGALLEVITTANTNKTSISELQNTLGGAKKTLVDELNFIIKSLV